MKKWLIVFGLFLGFIQAKTQNTTGLPVVEYPNSADTSRPLLIYLSGDGGVNSFTKELVKQFNTNKFPVILLNSMKYFWTKKTPAQTTADTEKIIRKYCKEWRRQQVLFVGYSFGADVSPFIFNRFPSEVQNRIRSIILISPSQETDFEVHVQLFSTKVVNGFSVPNEINQLKHKPIVVIHGRDETGVITAAQLQNKNVKMFTLKGGHHYNNNPADLVNTIIQNM